MIDNRKQWFLLILAAAWLLIVLALTASVYTITRDLHSFGLATFTAPLIAILRPLYRYHFPPDVADCEIQKLKLQLKDCNKKRP